jgi:hypothetical protein
MAEPYSVYLSGTLENEDQEQAVFDAVSQVVADLGDHMSEARFVGGHLQSTDLKSTPEPEAQPEAQPEPDVQAVTDEVVTRADTPKR